MENTDDILYKIKPKFNLIYELLMPTGRKIQRTIMMLIIFIGIVIILNISDNNLDFFNTNILKYNVGYLINIVTIIVIVALLIKLALHIIFQMLQYKFMSYTFYYDHMTYEDDFLNQHKKNIRYNNVKEVEIKRTVFDRIIGYGIIVIYTNAENGKRNGLIIYSVKNPKEHYQKIYDIIYRNETQKDTIINDENSIVSNDIVDNVNNKEENFEESLKDIRK